MKLTVPMLAVAHSLRYASACAKQGKLLDAATAIDFGRAAPAPGAIGKMVLDAILCGIDTRAYSEYSRVLFKPVKEE